MKKTFVAMILSGVGIMTAGVAFANDIKTINPAGKTSPLATFTQVYTKNLPGSEFYQASSCVDALSKYEGNNVLSFASNNALAGIATKTPCMPEVKLDQVYFFGEEFYGVCRKTGNTKTLATPGASFGAASVLPVDALVEDINAQNKYSLRSLSFNGSGAVALQVLSGDLDFGLIGKALAEKHVKSGAMECFGSTNPGAANYWGKTIKGKKLDLRLQILVLSKTNDAKIKTALTNSLQSADFEEHLKQGGFENVTRKVTSKQIDEFNKYISEVSKSYINK